MAPLQTQSLIPPKPVSFCILGIVALGFLSSIILLPRWLLPPWQLLILVLPSCLRIVWRHLNCPHPRHSSPYGSRKQASDQVTHEPHSSRSFQVTLNTVSTAHTFSSSSYKLIFLSFSLVPRVEPRALCMPARNCTIELCSLALSVVLKQSLAL